MHEWWHYILPKVFAENINALNKLYEAFPAPLIKQDGEIKGTSLDENPTEPHIVEDFSCALAIWSLRRVYLVLTATRLKDLNEHTSCPLYEKCPYKKRVDDDYGCQRAPWSVVRGMSKAECPYAAAAHTMGLWQNTLDIVFSHLE